MSTATAAWRATPPRRSTSQWGYDNRTVGIRSPISGPQARRVENRVIGADANPYVALARRWPAATWASRTRSAPKPEMQAATPTCRPTRCRAAWARRSTGCGARPTCTEVLGAGFITVYTEVKELEFEEFMKVISPWEREHLLLHV